MKKLLAYFFIGALVVSAFSCKDDEVDCSGNENKLDAYFESYDDADSDSDCDKMASISAKMISLIRKSKSCSFIKDAIADGDYENVEELIDDFELEVEDDMTDAGC